MPISSKSIQFHEFINSFPNPMNTAYHFRFRVEDKGHGYCWMDVQDFETVIPVYEGKIIVKVLRLDEAVTAQRKLRLKLKKGLEKHVEHSTRLNAEFVSSMMEDEHQTQSVSPMAPPKVSQPVVEVNDYKPSISGKINKIAPPPPSSSSNPSPQPTTSKTNQQTENLLFGYDDQDVTSGSSPTLPQQQKQQQSKPATSPVTSAATPENLFDFTDSPATIPSNISPPKSSIESPPVANPVPAATPTVKTTVTMDIDDDRTAAPTLWSDGLKAPAVSKGKLSYEDCVMLNIFNKLSYLQRPWSWMSWMLLKPNMISHLKSGHIISKKSGILELYCRVCIQYYGRETLGKLLAWVMFWTRNK